MADDKNIANLGRKESFVRDSSFGANMEKVNSVEQESVIEKPQDLKENITQTVDDIKSEGEIGKIQPIGGFQSQNAKRGEEIENILSQDLSDIYLQLTPDKQMEFKTKGEATAREINSLLDKAKIEMGKIIELIKKWLFIIPGVNNFFIEQEAKIKADEIIRLKS